MEIKIPLLEPTFKPLVFRTTTIVRLFGIDWTVSFSSLMFWRSGKGVARCRRRR